ncbi:MAG: serine/threonine protein kinase [Chloroflexi bacterium]|nr:serine/threonine protein kinase [Chloroflexota bacterium]
MEDLTGKQLGSYQIVAPLGEGGMAAVYQAYQPAMDRYVALKVLPRHFAADPQFVSRFQREAKILARLQHPHILPVFDFGEGDGYTYLVMPFVAGGTLTHLLQGQSLPLGQIRRIISQVGDALDYAHQHGLIHRDVKPSNVLIDERGNCLLMDFGLAKMVEGSLHLTTSGAILGTPAYMSPEQGLGQTIDARSDIYSLGVMVYELATGRVPYRAETPLAVVIKHINDPLPPPRTLNPALPEAVERVILKSLAKTPENRFAAVSEMVRALRAAIPEGQPVAPVEVAPRARTPDEERAALPNVAIDPRPVWQPIVLAAGGWAVSTFIGLNLSFIHRAVGGAIVGAGGGLAIGLAWRWLQPTVSLRYLLSLIAIWALAIWTLLIPGLLFIPMTGLAGCLTGLVLRRAQPLLTRRHVVVITTGWVLGWLLGGAIFLAITRLPEGTPLAGLLIILAVTLAGTIGSAVMFTQYARAMMRDK